MPLNVRALIVVLALSGLVFTLGKSTALHFMEEADFKRRRNLWLILSAAAFLCPNFWWFALIAAPAFYWGGKKDSHPLAFYLLFMSLVPSVPVQIPTNGLGIQRLFSLDIFRLLSLCVLVPTALRLRRQPDPNRPHGLQTMDLLVIGFGILTVIFFVPPDLPGNVVLHNSFTNELRDAFVFTIDVYVLYYVASRSSFNPNAVRDALAAFCISCTIMASVAAFEALKHWLLYANLIHLWGGSTITSSYLVRGGLLRAKASSGNPLALGYLLAIAFGFWLYLQSHLSRLLPKISVAITLWVGLLASFSRGPWLGAILIYFVYTALRHGGISRFVKSALVFLVVAGAFLLSPPGERFTNTLPFLGGKVAESSLTYRERLIEDSWQLIKAHPLVGDQLALFHMQALRQGQGIIDVVNTYVGVTLFHGFIGLALFLAFVFLALSKAFSATQRVENTDPDLALLGASLTACIVGTLLMLADCSFILGYVTTFYALAGLAVAYFRLNDSRRRPPTVDALALPPSELH